MTDQKPDYFEPRGAFGAAVPARATGVNETLLAALLDLVKDVRADRDRLLKELAAAARETASFKVSAESYRDKWDKEHQKVLSLERAAEEAGQPRPTTEAQETDREKLDSALAENKELREKSSAYAKQVKSLKEKLERKTKDWDEAVRSAHKKKEIIDKLRKQIHNASVGAQDTRIERDAALADVDELQAELAEANDKVAVLEKHRAEANKKLAQQSQREVKTITRVVNGGDVDAEGVLRHLETARTHFEDDPDKCLRALNRAHTILTTPVKKEEEGDDGSN